MHFGNVRIQLGSGNFADKLSQVPPILSKLQEQYADQPGVLHLENYTRKDDSIRFVPDSAAPADGTDTSESTVPEDGTGMEVPTE